MRPMADVPGPRLAAILVVRMVHRHVLAAGLLAALAQAQRVPEGAEPNGAPATATPLPIGREGFGVLATAGDSDWFVIQLAAATDLRIETGPGRSPQVGDTVVTLFDASGSPLRSNDDGVGCGLYSRLACRALAAGTYYVAVEAGAAGVANGSYTLDVRGAAPVAMPVPPVVAEGPENNDPRLGGTATAVALPVRCNGSVATTGANGDWDFYRFTLATESFVQVRVGATPTHPTPPVMDDPLLYLFDAAVPPNLLGGPFRAGTFGAWDAAIDVRLLPGAYQIAIRGWGGSVAGRYYLDIHRADAARSTVHAGGCGGRLLDVATTNVGPGAPLRVERPAIGTTYSVQGSNLGSGGFAFHVVGFASTVVDLTAAGAPGCILEVVFVDTPLQMADAAGNVVFAVPIPESLSLAGAALESQVAVFDFSNPLGITLSNRVAAVLGP